MLAKALLITKAVGHLTTFLLSHLGRKVSRKLSHFYYCIYPSPLSPSSDDHHVGDPEKNIVIIGASFAGLFAAQTLRKNLPPQSRHRVVLVEPHSHFHFTWVLPRFCVVAGHEHKAFIPYGDKFFGGDVRWVRRRAVKITKKAVLLSSSSEDDGDDDGKGEVPYEYLIIATGSGTTGGKGVPTLPSRVGTDGKEDGVLRIREMQRRIRGTERLVVVGGGAAGVELATDAKSLYPDKSVTLVHSRYAVMHRFGPELQQATLKGLQDLGVDLILGDRVIGEDLDSGFVTLKSGQRLDCDFLVNCIGQKPQSAIIDELSPSSISVTGHILVKPTLQVADESLPNIYACGDVAATGAQNPNGRMASLQAAIAADNILEAVNGNSPRYKYTPHWLHDGIKLTLGLENMMVHLSDGDVEVIFTAKDKHVDLDAAKAWKALGVKPFEDSEPVAIHKSRKAFAV